MWSWARSGTKILPFWRPKLHRGRLVLPHRRLVVASGAPWNAMFQCIVCTSAVIGRCVASEIIKFEGLVFHFALLSLLAMPLSAFLHEIRQCRCDSEPFAYIMLWVAGGICSSKCQYVNTSAVTGTAATNMWPYFTLNSCNHNYVYYITLDEMRWD